MATAQQYPLKTPKNSDLLVGTSIPDPNTNDDPKTSNFSVSSIGSFFIAENNIITGGGTLNTIPMFTPDGQVIGDSIINQKSNGLEIQVGTGGGAQQTTLGGTYIFAGALGGDVVTATNINGGDTGNVILSGGVIIGNEATDVLQITSAVSDYTGSSSTSAGQVLASTATGQLLWSSINAVSEIKTAQVTITDAQIRTLGTAPVEILPVVTGYIYEILSATTQSINSGGIGDAYDWSGQSGVISSRESVFEGLHKVEIPNNRLPSGGGIPDNSLYVGTPVAGYSRTGGSIKVTVTDNIDPTIPVGQTPSAQLLINITYKLTQVQ